MKQEDTILAQSSNSRNEALAIKARHLAAENYSLRETLHSIEAQITSLRTVNEELTRNNPQSVQLIINQLSKQNLNLEKALFRELKNNEKIACDLLMNNQLLLENENEFRDIIASYEVKIYDLRVNLQTKEAFFSNTEDKFLAERDELYNLPNRANMTYFNEMNELKLLIERHIIENTELQLVVIQKNEDIEARAQQLKICEGTLKAKEEWSQYQQKLQILSATSSTRSRATDNKARIQIEQELTRYDAKYKYITWHNNRRSDLSAQIYELKMFISKLLRDTRLRTEEKSGLYQKLAAKEQELQQVREAVSHLQKELFQQKIEGEFYRSNFKELTKVTTERKIKFYQEHYP